MGVQFGPSGPLARTKSSEAVVIVSVGAVGCIGPGGTGWNVTVLQELRSTNNASENLNHDLERGTGNRAHRNIRNHPWRNFALTDSSGNAGSRKSIGSNRKPHPVSWHSR